MANINAQNREIRRKLYIDDEVNLFLFWYVELEKQFHLIHQQVYGNAPDRMYISRLKKLYRDIGYHDENMLHIIFDSKIGYRYYRNRLIHNYTLKDLEFVKLHSKEFVAKMKEFHQEINTKIINR